ncbi:MAG TPA: iron export ABC transporter permease subunit FetB [Stenomitos sp.]
MTSAPLTIGQVILAGMLMFINIGLSMGLKLGLERSLLVAAVRMTAQLLLVGLVLNWLFSLASPGPILLVSLVMATLASYDAVQRTSYRFAGIFLSSFVSILSAAFLVTGLAVAGILRVQPWYHAQYMIPVLGMVLGNMMSGISLAADRFMGDVANGRDRLETLLALGASRWEAAHPEVRTAMRTGMIPTINSMMVMGLVSLPGMMTGQILAGAPPATAVRYQVVIMFVIASATALGLLGMILLTFRVLFDEGDRLRLDRLQATRR